MRARIIIGLFVCLASAVLVETVWALDEAILTPTEDRSVSGAAVASSQNDRAKAEKEFNSAMSVWFSHRYSDGKKLLSEFSQKHPNDRWRAEAELHIGCYQTYMGQYGEAKNLFKRLQSEFANSSIRTKATIRLGNIAEREGKFDDAIRYYSSATGMNPTWDQFRYANYRARKMMMSRGQLQARVSCGPVALAACLEALGRSEGAASARQMRATEDGVSLAVLEAQAKVCGAQAQSVEIPAESLGTVSLPVLGFVSPNHFIAVLRIDRDKAQAEDSIQGKHEMSLDALSKVWGGRAIAFSPQQNLRPLPLETALGTTGGCCGQADEDECLGSGCPCSQAMDQGDGADCQSCSGPVSGGSPTWQVNTLNLNLLVTDTPIWYNPGKGPSVAFTLAYSNENSNTGIFGRGWRCPYDMKVFFLPSGDEDHPTLQVHRDSGRVETYEWTNDGGTYRYLGRAAMRSYGYVDAIEITDGEVVLSLRGGGKCYFVPEHEAAEGRIHIIEDADGNSVTCEYENGNLKHVIDANGGVTDITTVGSGIDERVTRIAIPEYNTETHQQGHGNGRYAVLEYDDGYLTSITDMLGAESKLQYGALAWDSIPEAKLGEAISVGPPPVPADGDSLPIETAFGNTTDLFPPSGRIAVTGNQGEEEIAYAGKTETSFTNITRGNPRVDASVGNAIRGVISATHLSQAVTVTPELDPADGESLAVDSTAGFPESGSIEIWNGLQSEVIRYTGKNATETAFTGITRGSPARAWSAGSDVRWCTAVPYLYSIETPSHKTKFGYRWYSMETAVGVRDRFTVALFDVYECGAGQDYPTSATRQYEWYPNSSPYWTLVTKYPSANGPAKRYYTGYQDDTTGAIQDVSGSVTIAQFGYSTNRDRTTVTDGNSHTTHFTYDGAHNMLTRTDPLGSVWTYTYENGRTKTEWGPDQKSDALGNPVYDKSSTYDSTGRLVRVDGPLGMQVVNHYDSLGRLDYSIDARGKRTLYRYNEGGETRGFLTSTWWVEDSANPPVEHKISSIQYDGKGRRRSVTDAESRTTTYDYDDLDRIVKVTNPDDTFTETHYTCCHKTWTQDENGRRIYSVYDIQNRPFKQITSAKSTTLAQVITSTSPAVGEWLSVASVANLRVPASGQVEKVVILDEIISYDQVDALLNKIRVAQRGADGTRLVNAVPRDDEVEIGDAVGQVDTVPTTYGYDSGILDRMISLTDALNHTTYYAYYPNGRLKSLRYPDDKGEQYTYDGAGNLTMKEYGTFGGAYPGTFAASNDLTVDYEYDANNRLLRTYH